jgi:hypothetical protein
VASPQRDLRAMPVRSPDAEPELLVQVMIGDIVIRLRGRAAAVVVLAAFNMEELNREIDNGSIHFDYERKGVTLKPMPTIDHISFERPSETVTRFKKKRR